MSPPGPNRVAPIASPSGDGDALSATVAAAARGDAAAWRELVERFSGRVFGLVRAQCGDADLAEEIAQSTFATVAEKLPRYDERGAFEPWLFRIAMNRLRDEMRRRRRHAAPLGTEALAGVEGRAGGPSGSGLDAESRSALVAALGSLNEADREVISLRHAGGLSFQQMADTLGEPLGTLLARHHRALRKLRDFLEARGFDGP